MPFPAIKKTNSWKQERKGDSWLNINVETRVNSKAGILDFLREDKNNNEDDIHGNVSNFAYK